MSNMGKTEMVNKVKVLALFCGLEGRSEDGCEGEKGYGI